MPSTSPQHIVSYTATALLLICFSSATFAACKRPASLAFPEAELADSSEIKQANRDVNAYLLDMKHYLRCETSNSRITAAQRKMKKTVKQYNAMIEDYKVILAEYNKQKKAAPIVTASVSR